MPTAAAIYTRISSDPGQSRLGVARQEQDCRALAQRKDWPVAHVYVDNDISAVSGKPRPGYTAMLDAIKAGHVDAVITWDLDRLHRRPLDLEEFFAVCDAAGLRHLATVGGDVDLSTGEGLLVARIKGAVAAEEARKIRERTRRKKTEIAETGLPAGGGRRPFGYRPDRLTPDPLEADTLCLAAARVLAGDPLAAIVRDLNRDGPPPVHGGIWRTNAIRKALTAPRTAGLRQHQGRVIGDAAWPAILDRATWERVRAVLTHPDRRHNATARRYLLTGILACHCAQPMCGRGRYTGTRHHSYWCPRTRGGCGTAIIADPLDQYVTGWVLEYIDSDELAQHLHVGDDQHLLDEIAGCEARLETLAVEWADDQITRGEWAAARQTLTARIDAARRRLVHSQETDRVARLAGRGSDLAAAWPQLTVDRRRAIIAATVDTITIGPAVRGRGFFDPDRVTIT